MDANRRSALIAKLQEVGADKPCPRCGTSKFDILGEGDIPMGPMAAYNRSLPAFIPGVVVACSNCGFLMQHALAILKME